jgi:hypothetical protein
MTIYEPNDEVRPTGQEPAEFIEPQRADGDESEEDADPSARPSGSPPRK